MPKRVSFLRSPEWKALRQQALDRDDHKCCLCGSTARLCVHHIWYRKTRKNLMLEPMNLITVCSSCHYKIHKLNHTIVLLYKLSKDRIDQYNWIMS